MDRFAVVCHLQLTRQRDEERFVELQRLKVEGLTNLRVSCTSYSQTTEQTLDHNHPTPPVFRRLPPINDNNPEWSDPGVTSKF